MAERQYAIQPGSSLSGPPPSYASHRKPARQQSPSRSNARSNAATQAYPTPYGSGPMIQVDRPPAPPAHKTIVSPIGYGQFDLPQRAHAEGNGSELSMASYHPTDSRPQALRDVENLYSPRTRISAPPPSQITQGNEPSFRGAAYPRGLQQQQPQRPYPRSTPEQDPFLDQTGVPAVALTTRDSPLLNRPATATSYRDIPRLDTPSMMKQHSSYQGDGYDEFDPEVIIDDDDDHMHNPAVRSRSKMGFTPAVARPFSGRDNSGQYGPVPDAAASNGKFGIADRNEWRDHHTRASRRRKVILWIIGILILLGIVAGAIIGAIVASRNANNGSGTSSTSASTSQQGTHSGGLYDINSNEIQQVMGNGNLHKVFPAMDYTPLNAQYPDCLSNPPDQNNITLDVALLSQLTPAIRLYGTDCGQTEMVLTAISRLNMNSSMSIWLGVWLGNNATTNNRQLVQMYDILNKYPTSHFAGIIVGNEVLFREDMTLTELGTALNGVRTNLTAKGISLPVATSDLGDNWTPALAATSDIIMANVHPFFAGVTPDVAPGWTYNFWQQHDSNLVSTTTSTSWPKSIISEVGWPSEGGNDCGTATGSCPSGQGAVASVDNMNQFMEGFVCQSIANGTTYFWFEAFDEPWKSIYNTATDKWESKWGLMDSDRNLKSGLKIPDCGGKTISKPY